MIKKSTLLSLLTAFSKALSVSFVRQTVSKMASRSKEIVFIRHGSTEMNEWMNQKENEWGAPNFVDAGMWDTRLSERGVAQAKALAKSLGPYHDIELLCVSPLTRALQTAYHGFEGRLVTPTMRSVVSPLCAERLYLSSERGRPASELKCEFPEFDFRHMEGPSESWWYTPPRDQTYVEWRPTGTYLCPGEPRVAFEARLGLFKQWLVAQPESTIGIVCHWGVVYALTGKSLENCQTYRISLGDFIDMPMTKSD
jgi:broad specificity phosphatase PhoE